MHVNKFLIINILQFFYRLIKDLKLQFKSRLRIHENLKINLLLPESIQRIEYDKKYLLSEKNYTYIFLQFNDLQQNKITEI